MIEKGRRRGDRAQHPGRRSGGRRARRSRSLRATARQMAAAGRAAAPCLCSMTRPPPSRVAGTPPGKPGSLVDAPSSGEQCAGELAWCARGRPRRRGLLEIFSALARSDPAISDARAGTARRTSPEFPTGRPLQSCRQIAHAQSARREPEARSPSCGSSSRRFVRLRRIGVSAPDRLPTSSRGRTGGSSTRALQLGLISVDPAPSHARPAGRQSCSSGVHAGAHASFSAGSRRRTDAAGGTPRVPPWARVSGRPPGRRAVRGCLPALPPDRRSPGAESRRADLRSACRTPHSGRQCRMKAEKLRGPCGRSRTRSR